MSDQPNQIIMIYISIHSLCHICFCRWTICETDEGATSCHFECRSVSWSTSVLEHVSNQRNSYIRVWMQSPFPYLYYPSSVPCFTRRTLFVISVVVLARSEKFYGILDYLKWFNIQTLRNIYKYTLTSWPNKSISEMRKDT